MIAAITVGAFLFAGILCAGAYVAVYHNPFTRRVNNKDAEISGGNVKNSHVDPFSVRFSTTDIIIDNPINKRNSRQQKESQKR